MREAGRAMIGCHGREEGRCTENCTHCWHSWQAAEAEEALAKRVNRTQSHFIQPATATHITIFSNLKNRRPLPFIVAVQRNLTINGDASNHQVWTVLQGESNARAY